MSGVECMTKSRGPRTEPWGTETSVTKPMALSCMISEIKRNIGRK